jgi:hypothetical protein
MCFCADSDSDEDALSFGTEDDDDEPHSQPTPTEQQISPNETHAVRNAQQVAAVSALCKAVLQTPDPETSRSYNGSLLQASVHIARRARHDPTTTTRLLNKWGMLQPPGLYIKAIAPDMCAGSQKRKAGQKGNRFTLPIPRGGWNQSHLGEERRGRHVECASGARHFFPPSAPQAWASTNGYLSCSNPPPNPPVRPCQHMPNSRNMLEPNSVELYPAVMGMPSALGGSMVTAWPRLPVEAFNVPPVIHTELSKEFPSPNGHNSTYRSQMAPEQPHSHSCGIPPPPPFLRRAPQVPPCMEPLPPHEPPGYTCNRLGVPSGICMHGNASESHQHPDRIPGIPYNPVATGDTGSLGADITGQVHKKAKCAQARANAASLELNTESPDTSSMGANPEVAAGGVLCARPFRASTAGAASSAACWRVSSGFLCSPAAAATASSVGPMHERSRVPLTQRLCSVGPLDSKAPLTERLSWPLVRTRNNLQGPGSADAGSDNRTLEEESLTAARAAVIASRKPKKRIPGATAQSSTRSTVTVDLTQDRSIASSSAGMALARLSGNSETPNSGANHWSPATRVRVLIVWCNPFNGSVAGGDGPTDDLPVPRVATQFMLLIDWPVCA